MRAWILLAMAAALGAGCSDGTGGRESVGGAGGEGGTGGSEADGAGGGGEDAGPADAEPDAELLPWPDCVSEDGAPCCKPPPVIDCPEGWRHRLSWCSGTLVDECQAESGRWRVGDEPREGEWLVEQECTEPDGRGVYYATYYADGGLKMYFTRDPQPRDDVEFMCREGAAFAHTARGTPVGGWRCWNEQGRDIGQSCIMER